MAHIPTGKYQQASRFTLFEKIRFRALVGYAILAFIATLLLLFTFGGTTF